MKRQTLPRSAFEHRDGAPTITSPEHLAQSWVLSGSVVKQAQREEISEASERYQHGGKQK